MCLVKIHVQLHLAAQVTVFLLVYHAWMTTAQHRFGDSSIQHAFEGWICDNEVASLGCIKWFKKELECSPHDLSAIKDSLLRLSDMRKKFASRRVELIRRARCRRFRTFSIVLPNMALEKRMKWTTSLTKTSHFANVKPPLSGGGFFGEMWWFDFLMQIKIYRQN